MEIPEEGFIRELCQRKERRNNGVEWPRLLSEGVRDKLHQNYFPYSTRTTRALLKDKHVVMIGDSLVRAMYKDLIALLQTGDLCKPRELRVSNERSFYGDKQIDFLELDANRVFRQAREFQTNRHLIQYFFTNRAMREELEKTCLMIEATDEKPDLVIMNSAIWDVSRFPARHTQRRFNDKNSHAEVEEEINVAEEYFNRIAMFCRRMRSILPPSSTVVWLLMPPSTSSEVDRGFMSHNHLTFDEIRARLLDANVRAAQIVREAGFDVLDISFHCRSPSYVPFRIKDGVHWNVVGTRFMTQLLLGHLVTAWRLDRSVTKKWPIPIQERTRRDFRSHRFDVALDFLKQVNAGKHVNEHIHQDVRVVSLDEFNRQNKIMNPSQIPLDQLIVKMRTLLMVHKFAFNQGENLNLFVKAFRQTPAELSIFTQEDIRRINRMITEICVSWRDKMPSLAIGSSGKRKLELGGRRALLQTPTGPPLPSPPQQFSMPNRIADPAPRFPPQKRMRPNESHWNS